MVIERNSSIKRSLEDILSNTPSKRNSCPRNPLLYTSAPQTPKRNQPRNKLITSFKRFCSPSKSKNVFASPVSDANSSDDDEYFSSKSSYITVPFTPTQDKILSDFEFDSGSLASYDNSVTDACQLRMSSLTLKPEQQAHPIFHIPEILSKILSFVDDDTSLPCEESPSRRRPLSYEHALLIYKDEEKAKRIWNDSLKSHIDNGGNPETTFRHSNSLYGCLFVNRTWFQVTKDIITSKYFFANESSWLRFVKAIQERGPKTLIRSKSNTRLFIMHKLSKAKQEEIDLISSDISGSLEWIEMYICPKVLPTPMMLSGSLLKKLILPGSKAVNDLFLSVVAKNCPRLEILDLRACPMITDEGVISIGSSCRHLKTLNLGRHTRSEYITDRSVSVIAKNTNIETLGLAGCSITDRGIWDLAFNCSESLTRLSLNSCTLLTNNSIPRALSEGFLSKLLVLEIRHILNFTNLTPLVEFKRLKERSGFVVLIEGCEALEYRMREEEWKLDLRASAKMFNDISNWVNEEDDGDVPYTRLVNTI